MLCPTNSARGCETNCPTSYAKSLRYWRQKWPKPIRRVVSTQHLQRLVGGNLHETKRHRLGPRNCADLGGFAAANDLVGKSDVEVREAIGRRKARSVRPKRRDLVAQYLLDHIFGYRRDQNLPYKSGDI